MATSLEALLNIKANVSGEGAIANLSRQLGGLGNVAVTAQSRLGRFAGAAGKLVGPLSSVAGLATGAGLLAMGKSAINAADNMNDLRQKTGISVEMLSKFKQAAEKSGSSIDQVAGAAVKLGKNLASGNAQDSLKELGISATDASGKLKPTGEIMLEVADKFKAMPDGANKSALAIKLFGKSGADLIPMLNGGRKSIEDLKATMSGDFAQKADQLNDKMVDLQTSFNGIAVKVGEALIPILTTLVEKAIVPLLNGFGQLPGPIQAVVLGFGALALVLPTLISIGQAIGILAGIVAGANIGAVIAGWAGAIGPAMAGIAAAFTGLLGWLTGTFLPAVLAFFTGPVGWTVLAVAAVVAMCVFFREPIGKFLQWFGEQWQLLVAWFSTNVIVPLQTAWSLLVQWLSNQAVAAGSAIHSAWTKVAYVFDAKVVKPIQQLWGNAVQWLGQLSNQAASSIGQAWTAIRVAFYKRIFLPVKEMWKNVVDFFSEAVSNAVSAIKNAFAGVVNVIKAPFNNVLKLIGNGINTFIEMTNSLIDKYNSVPGVPQIKNLGYITVPQFATGGVVDKPTYALVGEAGREYIIPENKMGQVAAAWQNGKKGSAVFQAAAGAGSRMAVGTSTSNASAAAAPINITTGPVMQFEGKNYVSVDDLQRAVRDASRQTLETLRRAPARRALGLA